MLIGGIDIICLGDDECDEGRKRKFIESEFDVEGIYYNLKWE